MPRRGRDLAKWESSKCRACGVKITYKKTVPRQFCSLACCNSLRSADPNLYASSDCPTCGVSITYLKTWPRKYCSNKCAGKGIVGNIKHFKPSRRDCICEQCGDSFTMTPSGHRGRFCSLKCFGQWASKNIVGEKHPTHGKKFPDRPKNLAEIICPGCTIPFKVKASHASRRVCCSKQCQAKVYSESGRYAGANSPTWRGGYEPYYGPSWKPARRDVRNRDKVCQECDKSPQELGRALDVHHVIPFRAFGFKRHKEANALSNLVGLCASCHARKDKPRLVA